MSEKPTYEELEQRVKELGKEAAELRRLEKRLEENEKTLQALLNAPPETAILVDLEGTTLAINEIAAKRVRKNLDELIGLSLFEYLPHDLAVSRKAQGDKVARSGKPVRFQDERAERIYDTNIYPVFDVEEKVKALAIYSRDITETKRTEKALRESEERYRSLFKNNHSVMLLIDPESADIVDANPAAISYYGWGHEELTTKKITDINILTKEQVFQEMKKANSKQRRHFIFRHRLSNGDIRDVEVYSSPIKLHGQNLLYSIIHDITNRKQAEKALRESEDRFRDIAELLPETIFEMDTEGNLKFVNRMAFDNFGYTKEDFDRGLNCFEMMVPEDRARALKNARKILKGEEIGLNEYTALKKDGSTFPILLHSSPVYRERIPVGLRGVIIDITKRKQAEEELNRERQQFISIFDGIDEIIYISDPETYELLYTNAATKTIFGQDIVGKKCYKVFQSLDKPCSFCSNPIIFGENIGKPYIWEFQNKLNRRWYRCIDKSIRWPDGRMVRYEMAIDIDDLKQAEAALKEREVELERGNTRLKEVNSALKIILEKRDEDKKVLEEKVLINIKDLIIPYVAKLKKTTLNNIQEIYLELIQSNIEDILSPFAHKLSYKYLNFTPTELQVADLVKQGLRTKEIADLLNSSPETISGHRKSMRKKLKLTDKKSNLRTHLLSLIDG